jgi:hypothetical protein
MNDQWTDRLSEYLDGELDNQERVALEAHLGGCAECRATLAELRQVVARAKGLEDRPPKADLWPGVAERIGSGKVVDLTAPPVPGRRARRFSFSVPQLIAASIVLVLLTGSGMWLALQSRQQPQRRDVESRMIITPAGWTGRTDAAIADLQDVLTRNENRLDTATVRVVRENLAVIDRAIAEARRALEADPANTYLNLHLADTMRRKLDLLRRVNAIAAARS